MTEARTRLTEEQAREVHSLVVQGWVFSVFASMGAHILVWLWRPMVYAGQMVPPDWRFF
ncbi:light-harvesting protein [Roseomonas sp. HF4]|uniref:light-harvesting protein n=1 Tax=Roseomonas sp. HF4 TaxID=2562313 RepID=UPI0010C079AB|nr:light-harvesting protein [Roseomonas sp. HF4]